MPMLVPLGIPPVDSTPLGTCFGVGITSLCSFQIQRSGSGIDLGVAKCLRAYGLHLPTPDVFPGDIKPARVEVRASFIPCY